MERTAAAVPAEADFVPRRPCELKSRRAKNFLQSTRGDKRLPHPHARRHNRRTCRLATSCRTSGRAKEMDDSDLAASPDDDHVLGPFLGKLPPEILDVVVGKLSSCFRLMFAFAGRTCIEAVQRVPFSETILEMLSNKDLDRWWSKGMLLLPVAVMEGDVEMLEWMIQRLDGKGMKWRDKGKELSRLAASRGKLESVTCLRANGCEWDEDTCEAAAGEGHLEVLQWLRRNGCPWNEWTCTFAAGEGHLAVLQWARQNGCPWIEQTCKYAAEGGHLEVLQWARRNGCPWEETTCSGAAGQGHMEVLQ